MDANELSVLLYISLISISISAEDRGDLPIDLTQELKQYLNVNHSSNFEKHVFPLTKSKRELILTLHNDYRSSVKPTAANMKRLIWNMALEDAAVAKAATCNFGSDEMNSDFEKHAVGLNQDFASDENGRDSITRWWEQKTKYNITNTYCTKENECKQYIQLVWAESHSLGCGIARCSFFHFLFVCLYFPGGNIFGYRPYVIGKPCTQCLTPRRSPGDLCFKRLCVSPETCAENFLACVCGIEKCHNCGNFVTNSCRCECKEGWDSADCSMPCKDRNTYCGKAPGWQGLSACTTQVNRVRDVHCRHSCGQCVSVTLGGDHCCNGHLCKEGEVLSLDTCNCVELCPGLNCDRYNVSWCRKVNWLILLFSSLIANLLSN